MGDAAAASDNGIDVTSMMQRLEALQIERERLDARVEELEREDNALIQRSAQIIEEREALERRRIELDGETVEIDARRETLEDEQRALVGTRDALDHEYTDLYALLDKAVDEPAPPDTTVPPLTDRVALPGVAPLQRPAPWRTTLVIVPDADAPAPVAAPTPAAAPATFWRAYRGVIAIATCLVALITAGAIAAWPSDPPPTPIDPKEGLELVRAAFVPAAAEPAPTAAPVADEASPPVAAAVAESTSPRAEKRRTRPKKRNRKKTATK